VPKGSRKINNIKGRKRAKASGVRQTTIEGKDKSFKGRKGRGRKQKLTAEEAAVSRKLHTNKNFKT
jgi:hypothetical protein